ncbi:MAG: PD-(D/E)XK nuclease family protein, partial [Methylococcaceae bacterium]
PDLDQQLQRQALSWLKPINAAQERLIIVLHESDEAHHPLWDQLCSCLKNWQEIKVEESVLDANAISAFNNLLSVQSTHTPLSGLSRWWKLDSGVALGKRDKESYSSLESFFYSPYQWVLRYKARLTAGTLQSLSDGNLLKGTLVHHLYERYFNTHTIVLTTGKYQEVDVNLWFDQAISSLLAEEGAVLLQPGRLVEKEQFITTTRKSLHALIHQLQAAKVVHVEIELAQEAAFFGGNLGGYIDMKVTNDQGKEAVIDIKWGGANYRKTSLKENKHLQLVTYSYLRNKNSATKKWLPVAYFIIDGGVILAQNTDYFPEAIEIKPNGDENHAVIWQKMQKTWEWRRKQIDSGLIEVTVSGTEADSVSSPGEDALDIPETSDHFNDYKVLTGWGA